MNVNPGSASQQARGQPAFCAEPLCPLNRMRAGVAVRVKKLCASPEVAQRLREIGLGEEQVVKLLTCQANVICMVCNTRMALSAQLAETIFVEPIPSS